MVNGFAMSTPPPAPAIPAADAYNSTSYGILGFGAIFTDDSRWIAMLITGAVVLSMVVAICVLYACCFATTNGLAINHVDVVGAVKRARKRSSSVMPGYDPEKEAAQVLSTLNPYFTDLNAKQVPRNLGDGDFKGDKIDKRTGLPINLLVEGGEKEGKSYHDPKALALLTRGITIEKMLNPRGIYEKGTAQLQADPHTYFAMSVPTTKIKAFISHTWDKKPYDQATNERDRQDHAEATTKSIMWHIKFRFMCVGNFLSHLIIAAFVAIIPPVGFAVGLIIMFGFPLWIVGTESPFGMFRAHAPPSPSVSSPSPPLESEVLWFLGLSGNQFWMDKASIHQACMTKPVKGQKYQGTEHVFNTTQLSEEEKAECSSKYRVLNQAGVGLFDHFLTSSDELWVLFIPRYITRV